MRSMPVTGDVDVPAVGLSNSRAITVCVEGRHCARQAPQSVKPLALPGSAVLRRLPAIVQFPAAIVWAGSWRVSQRPQRYWRVTATPDASVYLISCTAALVPGSGAAGS